MNNGLHISCESPTCPVQVWLLRVVVTKTSEGNTPRGKVKDDAETRRCPASFLPSPDVSPLPNSHPLPELNRWQQKQEGHSAADWQNNYGKHAARRRSRHLQIEFPFAVASRSSSRDFRGKVKSSRPAHRCDCLSESSCAHFWTSCICGIPEQKRKKESHFPSIKVGCF